MITIVAAVAKNNVIGNNTDLPWHLPDDLRHFKELTLGQTVAMGRTTFESIVARLERPLPDRRNIVLTRDETFSYPDVEVVHDPNELLKGTAEESVYVIGGAALYHAMMPYAQKLYLTEIDAEMEGDTFFPEFDEKKWVEVSREHHPADGAHEFAFDFTEYDRL